VDGPYAETKEFVLAPAAGQAARPDPPRRRSSPRAQPAIEESAEQDGDALGLQIQREVTGLEEMHLDARHLLAVGERSLLGEDRIVAPHTTSTGGCRSRR